MDPDYETRRDRLTKAGQLTELYLSCSWNREDAERFAGAFTPFRLLPALYANGALDERIRVWADKRLETIVHSPTPNQRWHWTARFGAAHGELLPPFRRALWSATTWLLGLDLRVCLGLTIILLVVRHFSRVMSLPVCFLPVLTPFLFMLLRLLRYFFAALSLFVIPPRKD